MYKLAIFATIIGSAAAFTTSSVSRVPCISSTSSLAAAKSAEEDLELTLKVIMDNLVDDGAGIDDSDDDTPDAPAPAAAPAAESAAPQLTDAQKQFFGL